MSEAHVTPSYINITAVTSSETPAIAYPEILRAAAQRDKMTFLKLMWLTSANTVLYSQRLEELETQRQALKTHLDSLSLALSELKNAPVKEMTESQQQQRAMDCKEMEETLKKLINVLNNLNREIIYLDDYNEDRQTRFRQVMSGYYEKLDHIAEEKLEIIMAYLKSQNITGEIRKTVKAALVSPEVQEAYLKSAGQVESSKRFVEKLKGWFRS